MGGHFIYTFFFFYNKKVQEPKTNEGKRDNKKPERDGEEKKNQLRANKRRRQKRKIQKPKKKKKRPFAPETILSKTVVRCFLSSFLPDLRILHFGK